MRTEAEIKADYKSQHDELTATFYQKKRGQGVSSEEQQVYDLQHGKIWNDMEVELIAGGYIIIPEPRRNLEAEIDELKAEIAKLKVM